MAWVGGSQRLGRLWPQGCLGTMRKLAAPLPGLELPATATEGHMLTPMWVCRKVTVLGPGSHALFQGTI